MSLYPDIPNLPGVPPVLRSPQFPAKAAPVIAVLATLGQLWRPNTVSESNWGVFDSDGKSMLDADSFLAFGHRKQSVISDFPIQAGGFATYNKVQVPFANTIRVSKGGTEEDRAALLRQLDVLQASMDTFTILTPERAYLNVNVEWYEVARRDKEGAYFLTEVDLFFREIQDVFVVFTNTEQGADTSNAQAPSAQSPVNQGAVQPQAPSVAAQGEATKVLAGGPP